jgi:hypothetical protein
MTRAAPGFCVRLPASPLLVRLVGELPGSIKFSGGAGG